MRFAWIAEAPFNFMDGDRLSSCDIELARHLIFSLGETFEPIETEFHLLLPGLVNIQWDGELAKYLGSPAHQSMKSNFGFDANTPTK